MSKFILLINGRNDSGEEYDSYDDAYCAYEEASEGMIAGADILGMMGDVDESEICDPDDCDYEIVEIDETGRVIDRTKL